MMHVSRWIVLAALAVLGMGNGGTARGDTGAVDVKTLAARGKATAERIAKDGAAWTATIDMRRGPVIEVRAMTRGGKWHWIVSGRTSTQASRIAEITSYDGNSFVSMMDRRDKFRDYEADFGGLAVYAWLELAQIGVFSEADGPGKLLRMENGMATGRVALVEPLREQVKTMLDQMQRLRAASPANELKPEVKELIAQLEDLLAHGVEQRFDEETGVTTRISNAKMTLTRQDFRVLSDADEKVFVVKESDFKNETARWTKSMERVVMMAHVGLWKPGLELGAMDLVLLNTETGKSRRVAFAGAAASVGCFSADRQKVWVTGASIGTSGLRIVEVDLKTGENRAVGGARANSGLNMLAKLSVDGKRLCFMHREVGQATLDSEIVVVELDTGKETVVATGDFGVASWAAGDVMVVPVREKVDMTKPEDLHKVQRATICKMDMAGKLTELVNGSMSEVVGDGTVILFKEEQVWKVCDLDGKNVRVVGDGLSGCSFPAAAPDGKRVMMMDFRDKVKGPQPIIVTWEDGKIERVEAGPGFWGMPGWK